MRRRPAPAAANFCSWVGFPGGWSNRGSTHTWDELSRHGCPPPRETPKMGPLASLPGQAPMARWALALALALAPTPHHHTQPPARQAHPAIGCKWGGKPPSVGLFIDDSLTNPLGGLRGVARWHGGFAPRRGVAPLAGASGWGGFGWMPSACVKPHATSGATARPRAGTAANSKETLATN